MILGEIRKILRNRVFIVMLASIFAANIVGILYCAETKNDSYYDLKQEEQRQYIETQTSHTKNQSKARNIGQNQQFNIT